MLIGSLVRTRQNLLVVMCLHLGELHANQPSKQLLLYQHWNLSLLLSKWLILKIFLANIPLGMKPTLSVSMHCNCQLTIVIVKNKTYNGKNKHIQLRHTLVKSLLNI